MQSAIFHAMLYSGRWKCETHIFGTATDCSETLYMGEKSVFRNHEFQIWTPKLISLFFFCVIQKRIIWARWRYEGNETNVLIGYTE